MSDFGQIFKDSSKSGEFVQRLKTAGENLRKAIDGNQAIKSQFGKLSENLKGVDLSSLSQSGK